MSELLVGLSTPRLDVVRLTSEDDVELRTALEWDAPETPITGWPPRRVETLFARRPLTHSAGLRRGPTLVGAVLVSADGRSLAVDGFVVPAWRGVGYAPEALGAIVDRVLGPEARDFDEVRLTVSGGNTAAIRAARAVGFEASAIPDAPRRDRFRGDHVRLVAGPSAARRERVTNDAARVAALARTLGGFELQSLVADLTSRAGRAYPLLQRASATRDELPPMLAPGGGDFSRALDACRMGADIPALVRDARGLDDAQVASLQRELRTSHNSASEYAEALRADELLRRYRKGRPR